MIAGGERRRRCCDGCHGTYAESRAVVSRAIKGCIMGGADTWDSFQSTATLYNGRSEIYAIGETDV